MNVNQLNELIGSELGRTPYNDSTYKWEYSEDLFWPAYATGRNTTKNVEALLIGGGTETVPMVVPEYRRDRMSHKLRNQWVVTKWFAPSELDDWNSRFPGADYPAQGYRIQTNWANKPEMLPTLRDTQCLIWALKKQLGMTTAAMGSDMDAEDAAREQATQREIEDEIRDIVPAFANHSPGKRGSYVSVPYTALDREKGA